VARSRDHFDLIARHYDRFSGSAGDLRLPAILDARAGDLVLDVGGGTGRHAAALGGAGARVVICDRSPEMLRQACAKGLPCVLADACRLPFADGRFDRVLAVDAFHHFVHPTAAEAQPLAAEQMLRVLAPGGRVVIGEPDIRVTGVKAIALAEKLLLMRSRILAPEPLTALFTAAGADRLLARDDHPAIWLVFESRSAGS
jgi:demethylmenaquinone methyltransferase/2-methoxy-6-polyprenyl-1,4-benzoquinol methylase